MSTTLSVWALLTLSTQQSAPGQNRCPQVSVGRTGKSAKTVLRGC